jgi:hypothetical protein
MTLEHECLRLRPRRDHVGHVARDAEPRPAIREWDDLLAIHVGEDLARTIGVGQRDDGIGVGVHHGTRVDEAVQQGLDRGPRPTRLLQGVPEVVDHLLVAHVLPVEQRAHVVDAHAGKILALDRLQIGATALDPEHGNVAPAVITLGELDGRVSAAPHDQGGLGADQTRGVHEQVEIGQRGGVRGVPARLHRATISRPVHRVRGDA